MMTAVLSRAASATPAAAPPQATPSAQPVEAPTATSFAATCCTPTDRMARFGDFDLGDVLGQLGFGDARRGVDALAEQRRLEGVVADVQAKYAKLGIRPDEGNGPVKAVFLPQFPNAAYTPVGYDDEGIRIPADAIGVGVDDRSGQSYVDAEDVIAHELGHRLVQHIVRQPLSYQNLMDVGINESLADTFSAMIDTDDPWTIGDKLVGGVVRSMDHPEQVGEPGTMKELAAGIQSGRWDAPLGEDASGQPVMAPDPHAIAGVPNKAASIIGKALGVAKMSQIYIDALRKYVEPNKGMGGLAMSTMRAAADVFGASSPELQATRDAWLAVGVLTYKDRPAAAA